MAIGWDGLRCECDVWVHRTYLYTPNLVVGVRGVFIWGLLAGVG